MAQYLNWCQNLVVTNYSLVTIYNCSCWSRLSISITVTKSWNFDSLSLLRTTVCFLDILDNFFSKVLESTSTCKLQYTGFFTRHTQTFYEPYLETSYNCTIEDDRADFYLDKNNKLYLYVNTGGNPTNLDSLPSQVQIKDQDDNIYTTIPQSGITLNL